MCVGLFRQLCWLYIFIFFFKQKTAYEMRISDWSSDVCSSDLVARTPRIAPAKKGAASPGAMSATGPANIGWRPSVLSAMILPVGPLVTAATARAPPANAEIGRAHV